MSETHLSIRQATSDDVPNIASYWVDSEHDYLKSMGVDVSLIPKREDLINGIGSQVKLPIERRNAYVLIWLCDGKPIGHSNTNPTTFGDHAFMHLHIWNAQNRRKGYGLPLLKMSVQKFFEDLKLERLYSQPFLHNQGPHILLEKLGFSMIKEYTTVPGSINFEQRVKLWQLTKGQLD